jgi:hypothetical protein
LRVVDAQVTFIVEGKGSAPRLILHQNGRNLTGKRVR